MQLSIYSHPEGVEVSDAHCVVYDLPGDSASLGPCRVAGPALSWQLSEVVRGTPLLSAQVSLDPSRPWLVRCDRVDFPPGSVAHRHTHPGPGIRCMLFGTLTVSADGHSVTHGALSPWFERGPDPVLATAAADRPSAFVRVMLLPAEWAGKRTIQYVDPADARAPSRQSARVYLDEPLRL